MQNLSIEIGGVRVYFTEILLTVLALALLAAFGMSEAQNSNGLGTAGNILLAWNLLIGVYISLTLRKKV